VVISHDRILNPNDPKDAEAISEILKESDDKEDEDYNLYVR